MSNILKIRDENGNFVGIPSIKGDNGKSAYEQAVEGGYKGTEEEFIQILGNLGGVFALQLADTIDAEEHIEEHISDKNNPHGVTAAQVGALPVTGGQMKASIGWNDGKTFVVGQGDGNFIIRNYKLSEEGNDDFLAFHNTLPLQNVLRIYRNGTPYDVYGKHNKPTASDVGALPIEGGVITGSVLGLGNGLAQIVGGPTYSSISAVSQNDYNNHRILRAINPDLTSYPLEKAAQIIDSRNGVPYEYNLFGEHNANYFGLSRLYVGSYVGTGVYGSSGETTIPQVLPFKPKFMYVVSAANIKANLFFDLGVGFAITSPGSTTTHQLSCRLDGTKPYWYSNSDALNQLNATANTYYFVALG